MPGFPYTFPIHFTNANVASEGKEQLLSIALNGGTQEDIYLKLYNNDVPLIDENVASDYTEPTSGNYTDVLLLKGNWEITTAGTITEGTSTFGSALFGTSTFGRTRTLDIDTTAVYAEQEVIFDADAGTIYGYFMVGVVSGKLYWVEKFDNPEPTLRTKTFKITPKIVLL